MSKTAETKRTELLASGRVRVVEATVWGGTAVVAGAHDDYRVVVRDGVARCPCPGFRFRRTCSHSRAALLVVGAKR